MGNDLPSESIKATAPLSPYKLASHPIQLDATDGIYAEEYMSEDEEEHNEFDCDSDHDSVTFDEIDELAFKAHHIADLAASKNIKHASHHKGRPRYQRKRREATIASQQEKAGAKKTAAKDRSQSRESKRMNKMLELQSAMGPIVEGIHRSFPQCRGASKGFTTTTPSLPKPAPVDSSFDECEALAPALPQLAPIPLSENIFNILAEEEAQVPSMSQEEDCAAPTEGFFKRGVRFFKGVFKLAGGLITAGLTLGVKIAKSIIVW